MKDNAILNVLQDLPLIQQYQTPQACKGILQKTMGIQTNSA